MSEVGRRALVTGASSGIGAATAEALALRGCDVWLTYHRGREGVDRTMARCEAAGAQVRASRLDLGDPGDIERLVAEVDEVWGSLHVLVNNGGACPYRDPDDITVDDWDAVLATNARGTFLLLRGALPLLRAAEGDRSVVNLSSVAGEMGAITTPIHYAASKAAILAITRSYARVLAPERIRVNAVAPGPVDSAITSHLEPEARVALASNVPLGRFGTPAEVAAIVGLLASPDAGFVTGATYDVNGGLRIDA
jgi:3-oxoacyl-[acyl-carrier protein] reductase